MTGAVTGTSPSGSRGPSGPVAVIPARYGASRFPGKPLARLLGVPMVRHVVDRCAEAGCFSRIVVATDDARIAEAVSGSPAEAVMTSAACATGTDRVAEVAGREASSGERVWVNVQGDEPALAPESLRTLCEAFAASEIDMATLVRPIEEEERPSASVVKVVLDEAMNALYFSRADIPYPRRDPPSAGGAAPSGDAAGRVRRWAHVGIYAYRARTLLRLAALPPTALELEESLEQLRALGHGVRIACRATPHRTQAVDVPDDVPLAEAALRALLAHVDRSTLDAKSGLEGARS